MAEKITLEQQESDQIRITLIETLAKVKKFKTKKNNQINQLTTELNALKKQFKNYKLQKEKEIKKIKAELLKSKKSLKHKKKSHKKKVHKKIKPKPTVILTPVTPKETPLPLPSVNHIPWVEVKVEDGITIHQLALKYYGDSNEYRKIYAANKHKIGKNLIIHDGMFLKIPITNSFQEQPFILNTN